MTLTQLSQNVPVLIGYVISIICLIQIFVIFFSERKNIILDLRGRDKIWQFIELSSIVWLTLFPCVVVASLLGVHVDMGVWTTMDAIYFMNLGGKISSKWMDNKAAEKVKKDGEV